jgi:nicotinamide mononucleotide (NMN) deamidase PncC
VGLVHIGLADERGATEMVSQLPGDRERIRQFSTQRALNLVRRYYLFPQHGRV